MTDVVVGIDPGLKGGVAVMSMVGEVLAAHPMPTVKARKGFDVDPFALARIIEDDRHRTIKLAVIEEVGARPAQGSISGFRFGTGYGMIRGVLGTLGIPYVLVRPQEWQGNVLDPADGEDDDTKARSVAFCRKYFPGLSLLGTARSRTPHDGISDAVCLAEWARRLHTGVVQPRPAKAAKKRTGKAKRIACPKGSLT